MCVAGAGGGGGGVGWGGVVDYTGCDLRLNDDRAIER